ncbi:hypothetical protein O6H91_08G031300 [Diphasiastrum complanatum]|uniref:Uncharacterized protein n=2 Tax=Diphasiastrum complanatum TaxID=34168 RepID=A0ACC2CW70_DIPCM|nr:hypothetical protein O6H91_08G031300 [Diphasiastrum complanatum]
MATAAASSSSSLRKRTGRSSAAVSFQLPEKEKPDTVVPLGSSGQISFGGAFVALMIARYFSATSNLIHDCDEVFNYWEPLHYLLYKSGFQTWEYSSQYALRSYLYLLLHALLVGPAAWWYGSGAGKVGVFYSLRFALGALSALTEAALVESISRRFGRRVAAYTLVLLCFTSGCFNASTSFLPSTFSMYGITLASALLLADELVAAVAVAAFGVLVGWPFSVLATAPLVVYALFFGKFWKVFLAGAITSICTILMSLLVDHYFYGQWKFSILNLVIYNVAGGGDSSLYGVEGFFFYLKNALLNFNFAIVFALMLPVMMLLSRRSSDKQLFCAISPIYLWLLFMSLQPHKEERFIYPVYPLICLASAAAIERIPDLVSKVSRAYDPESLLLKLSKLVRPLAMALILVLSYSRTTSLLQGYSAPMHVYRQLSSLENTSSTGSTVCIGSEWHRFPSSFFLPSSSYKVSWVDDGFRGLLPFPFNSTAGGTRVAPAYFNNQNQASSGQFLTEEENCSLLVELALKRSGQAFRGENATTWEAVAERSFLDNQKSPPLYRAFFIPWLWENKNTFGVYRLSRKR